MIEAPSSRGKWEISDKSFLSLKTAPINNRTYTHFIMKKSFLFVLFWKMFSSIIERALYKCLCYLIIYCHDIYSH